MTKNLFVLQARIDVAPTNPNPVAQFTEGGFAHGLAFSGTAQQATAAFIRHLRKYHWDVQKLVLCQQTKPELVLGRPSLERLLAVANQHGVASEVVPAAFRTDPGQAN